MNSSKKISVFQKAGVFMIAVTLILAMVAGCTQTQQTVTEPDSPDTSDAEIVTGSQAGEDTKEASGDEMRIIAAAEQSSVAAGDSVTVTIKIENVKEVSSIALTATWDEELTLMNADYAEGFNGLKYTPEKNDDGKTGWEGLKCPFTFNWVALNAEDAVEVDCTFVTLQFKTAEDKPGTYHFNLTADPDNIFDSTDTNIPFAITNAEIVVTAK